jgi:hypothetical protein
VELPATSGSVELLDVDGVSITSASMAEFDARLDGSLWFPPGRT